MIITNANYLRRSEEPPWAHIFISDWEISILGNWNDIYFLTKQVAASLSIVEKSTNGRRYEYVTSIALSEYVILFFQKFSNIFYLTNLIAHCDHLQKIGR